jgi:hypothetical protein
MRAVITSNARPTGHDGIPTAVVSSLVIALLASREFETPSVPAQRGRRRFPFFNDGRDFPSRVI